jgi:hypothetical protein
MAALASGADSDSDSSYGYDFDPADEDAIAILVASASTQKPGGPLSIAARPGKRQASSPLKAQLKTPRRVNEALQDFRDDDFSFDISELEPAPAYSHKPRHAPQSQGGRPTRVSSQGESKLSPAVPRKDPKLASFVSQTKPRSIPTALANQEVKYPDCESRFLPIAFCVSLTDESD